LLSRLPLYGVALFGAVLLATVLFPRMRRKWGWFNVYKMLWHCCQHSYYNRAVKISNGIFLHRSCCGRSVLRFRVLGFVS
jgi:hypothetical protein